MAVQQGFHLTATVLIEPMQGFVQDIQRRVLDKSAGDKTQALFPAGEPQKRFFGQMSDPELLHPCPGQRPLPFGWTPVETFRVKMSAGHDIQRRGIHPEGPVQFRTYESDAAFDVPDTLPAPPWTAEEFDIMGIGLGIVGADEAQKRTLTAAVGPGERPMLPFPDGPGQRFQDHAVPVPDRHVPQPDDRRRQKAVQIGLARHFLPWLTVPDRDDMRDEGRNLRRAGQDQDQGGLLRKVGQKLREQRPVSGIQADEGIVDDKPLRSRLQRLQEPVPTQFSGREGDQRIVRFPVHTGEIPTLLHEKSTVSIAAVGVPEGDI